jgi:hypothetical protein
MGLRDYKHDRPGKDQPSVYPEYLQLHGRAHRGLSGGSSATKLSFDPPRPIPVFLIALHIEKESFLEYLTNLIDLLKLSLPRSGKLENFDNS